jgi:CRISPR-associated protein Cas2
MKGINTQKSIFEAELSGNTFKTMKTRLEQEIVWEQDGIKYFPLCEKCEAGLEVIGQGDFIDPDQEYYIL